MYSFHQCWLRLRSVVDSRSGARSYCRGFKTRQRIDRMLKRRPKKCSFAFVLIGLTSLVSMDKTQKKCCFRTRLVGLISTKTKENFLATVYGSVYSFLSMRSNFCPLCLTQPKFVNGCKRRDIRPGLE